MTKFGDTTLRVSLCDGAIKFQTFWPLTLDAQNFQDKQVRKKIQFDKIWGYQNENILLKQEC